MLRLITLALLATLLAACTPFSVRTAWLPEERAKIKEVNAEVIVVQDEILVDVAASNYGAGMQNNGGLIAIALNNIETNSRVQQSQKPWDRSTRRSRTSTSEAISASERNRN